MPKKAPPKEDTDSDPSDDEVEDQATQDANSIRRTRMQQEFDTLHNEMEIAQYGTTETGQLRRKLPRHQSRARTQKRRLLEKQDDHEQAVEMTVPEEGTRKRMRGSRAAQEEHVLQGSYVYGSQSQGQSQGQGQAKADGNGDEESDDENDHDDENDDDDAIEADEEYEDEEKVNAEDQDDVEDDDQEEVQEDDDQEDDEQEEDEEEEIVAPKKPSPTTASARKKAKKPPKAKSGKKRRLFRLKNFTSQRMAQRHGDALGAHARGQPKVAIQKLKQIAREVPSASQVYSSLGMVYEDMLSEIRKKNLLVPPSENHDSEQANVETDAGGDTLADEDVPDNLLAEQLDLARKAYGAYHVAAILCKKDYTLWVRAADSATEIADLHSSVNDIPGIQVNVGHFHRREKERWLSEAKNDYKVADNLKPPGIDVPARLASTLIQIGSLSEALTLLTDLKNSRSTGQEHSEFEASYKAWLLYSDLMLRIGHECTKWNSGNQTNENYMFRRWLRKLSKSFDWKERRLQALSKALEAAAGSNAAIRYIDWLQNRAVVNARNEAEKVVAGGDPESIDNGISADQSATDMSSEKPTAEHFEQEKSFLIKRNQADLAAFDKTTNDMALAPGSIPTKEREKGRDALVKSHKATVVALVGEYHQSQTSSTLLSESAIESTAERSSAGDMKTSLSPSSSCATVYKIASELMRHLLKAQLYDGAKLVGEAVSSYLKERAALLDKRIEARESYKELQNRPTSIFAFQKEVYDAVGDRSDGEGSDVPLSDEDELEESFGAPTMQQSLRRGALPPELTLLYGLSLVGEGGRNFLAAKCLESIDALEEVPLTSSTKDAADKNHNTGSSWMDCQRAASEPLGRLAAYALTVDVLRATGKEKGMAALVAPLFARYFELLKGEGAAELSLNIKVDSSSALYETTYQQVSRAVLASFRYQFYEAESLLSNDDRVKRTKGKELSIANIESLFEFFPILWMVESDASVASECIELLSLFASAFAQLTEDVTQEAGHNEKELSDLLRRLQKLVSLLCGGVEFDLLGTSDSSESQESTADLTCVPFANDWLSSERDRLLLRTNNLCIATNVSLFSGWEGNRFSLQLLRHRDVENFFGLTMQDEQVAGYLGPIREEELSDQWDMLNSQLPQTCSYNFRDQLGTVKETLWYIENEEKHKARQNSAIYSFGEDVGLSILLTFSRICIRLAVEIEEQHEKDRLLFTSMSIILPMSQFSLNQKLVESKLSKEDAEEANSTYKALANVPAKQLEERLGALHDSRGDGALLYKTGTSRVPKSKSTYVRPPRRIPPSPNAEDMSLHEWFYGENPDSHLVNLVAIPCSVLQHSWGESIERSTTQTPELATAATDAMQKLHTCMQELRACCSEQAVEKQSLEVAGALVQLAPVSHNPFLCLQQAAMFAGNSFKGGNSNLDFREPLPSKESCTPLEALIILGRADCLQAVHFCPEAAFLCSFVASVCSQHRIHGKENFGWDEKWKIIAIVAYNVSVMIRHTALMLLQEQDKREDSSWPWELEVIGELKRGRAAGRSWKASIRTVSVASDLENLNSGNDKVAEHNAAGVGGDAMFVDAEDGAIVDDGDAYPDAGTTDETDLLFQNVVPASNMVHQDDDSSVELFAV